MEALACSRDGVRISEEAELQRLMCACRDLALSRVDAVCWSFLDFRFRALRSRQETWKEPIGSPELPVLAALSCFGHNETKAENHQVDC